MLECLQATDDRGRKSSVILNLFQDRVVLREFYSRETELLLCESETFYHL